jgi:hypothetical protein
MRRMLHRLAVPAVVGLGLFLAGCHGRYTKLPESEATLEGTVTRGTDKVPVALVIVQGTDSAATGYTDDDGHYKIENVPLGEVRIAVNTEAGKGVMKSRQMARSQGKDKGPLPKMIDVPAKYADPTTSGFTTTIEKGENTYAVKIPN